jgi:hypothetical protein
MFASFMICEGDVKDDLPLHWRYQAKLAVFYDAIN